MIVDVAIGHQALMVTLLNPSGMLTVEWSTQGITDGGI